jgi:Ca2+-transporting ATPase
MRSAHSLFQIGPFTNRQLNRAAVFSVVMVAVVLFTPLSTLFGLIRLTGTLYGIGVGLILTPFFVMELAKWIGRHSANRK